MSATYIGQTARADCWIDGKVQPVRVKFTRLGNEYVRLQAVSARPLSDVPTISYGPRYRAIMADAEWITRPGTDGPELTAWALGKLKITAANTEGDAA